MNAEMQNRENGFKKENEWKVAFVFGQLSNELDIPADWDEIALECENIVLAWNRKEDIKNLEEEGYILVYAERILREKYAKQSA